MTDREKAIDFLECRRAYYASLSTDPNPNVKATKVCGYSLAESANACLIAIEALKLIPNNATNIGVIKSLFPNGSQVKGAGIFIMDDKRSNLSYDIDWGNAPYRKE